MNTYTWDKINQGKIIKELKSFQQVISFSYLGDQKMWLKLNLTQPDLPDDWKADEHRRWSRCWPRNIQQTEKKNTDKL